MTDTEQVTAAKKKLADERAARDKTNEAQAKMATAVKPTPTQEENDLAASGVHIIEHEPDGSADPNEPQNKQQQAEPAKPRAGYQTKVTNPST
ncbi:MAG: hypothetical protein E6J90_08825 [Deltaproteobacteria bacterium]|nr:MAG: hypothetical protein E6J90_08825 [Deltaproteobacteria bacterium]